MWTRVNRRVWISHRKTYFRNHTECNKMRCKIWIVQRHRGDNDMSKECLIYVNERVIEKMREMQGIKR